MRSEALILIFVAVIAASANPGSLGAQAITVSGRVIEAETGRPLPGAHVFLARTTYGEVSDAEGVFAIERVQPGAYTLVVSSIGYETARRSVQILKGEPLEGLEIELSSSFYELEGVEVSAEGDRAWQRHYETFREHILGATENAESAEILNREVLQFATDAAGRLTASADEPMFIENAALGYRITYVLLEFILDPQAGVLRFQGEPFFEEMPAASDQMSAEWMSRRQAAFEGSLAHLFAAIIDETTFDEGFSLYEGRNESPVDSRALTVSRLQGDRKEIAFETPLKIIFTRRIAGERGRFSLFKNQLIEEISLLHRHAGSVTIGRNGSYWPPDGLTMSGALGQRRLADMTPANFGDAPTLGENESDEPDSTHIVVQRTDKSHFQVRTENGSWSEILEALVANQWDNAGVLLGRPLEDGTYVNLFRLIDYHLFAGANPAVSEWLADQSSDITNYTEAERLRRENQLSAARKALISMLERTLDIPLQPVLLSLARVYFAEGDPLRGQGAVTQAIEHIQAPEEAALVFEEFKYVLEDDELIAFNALENAGDVKRFFNLLWLRRHPFPGRADNPRLTEHYRRLLYAEANYVHHGERAWATDPDRVGALELPAAYHLNRKFNDKGLIYIRHGEPADRITTLSGDMDFRTASFDIENLPDDPSGDVTSFELREKWMPEEYSWEQAWQPNESWRYEHPSFDVHFVLRGGGGNWRLTSQLPRYKDIFEDREQWGGIYAEMALNARAYESAKELDIYAGASGGGMATRMQSALLESGELSSRFIDQNTKDVSLGLGSDRHTWPAGVEPLTMHPMLATFRGEAGLTDVSIYFALPAGQLQQPEMDSSIVETGFSLFNASWESMAQSEGRLVWSAASGGNAIVSSFEASAPADSYSVAVYALQEATMRRGGYKAVLQMPDYSANTLLMSDIILAHNVQSASAEPPTSRKSLTLIPNPTSVFATSEPLHLVFELYNLVYGENDETDYSIRIQLNALKKKLFGVRSKPDLTVEARLSGRRASTVEFPEVDVSAVAPGRYELVVEVRDRVTNATTRKTRVVELVR